MSQTRLPERLHLPAFSAVADWTCSYRCADQAVGGAIALEDDARFSAWLETGVEIRGKRVLELGPLEGAHSKYLCEAGAREVVAVEGRPQNYLKCCLVKNVFSLDAAVFVLDRIENVTRQTYGRFDLCLASGVLYHAAAPAAILSRLAEMSSAVLVWTHLASASYPRGPAAEQRFGDRVYRGKWYREPATARAGLDRKSFWPFRDDLRRMFADSGFEHVDEIAVDWLHPQGAAWQGTLWRQQSLKPAAARWLPMNEQPPHEEPAAPARATRILRGLARRAVPQALRRRLRGRLD